MRLTRTRIVLLALLVMLGTTGAASSIALQEANRGQLVFAEFTDVSPILPALEVKVRGVTVGTTGESWVEPDRGVAVLPLDLAPAALPLHTDATVTVAPVSILGERFINLDPGTPAAPELPRGQRIPANQAHQTVDFQDVVNTLDDPTSSGLAALTTTLGQGMAGNGENAQRAITALRPALGDTDKLAQVLKEQNELLGQVIDQAQPVTSALAADDGKVLDRLVGSAEQVLSTTAAQDRALDATIAELPSTLAEARKTLTELAATADSTGATLGELRPTTDNLTSLSHELRDFSEAADPALASLNPVLDRANELLDEARPVAADLRESGPGLRRSVGNLRPIVDGVADNLDNALGFVRNWALTTNGRDGLSHYFRAHYVISPQQGTGNVPGGTPRVPNMPAGLLHDQKSPGDSATGLRPEQEKGALGFLLGGK